MQEKYCIISMLDRQRGESRWSGPLSFRIYPRCHNGRTRDSHRNSYLRDLTYIWKCTSSDHHVECKHSSKLERPAERFISYDVLVPLTDSWTSIAGSSDSHSKARIVVPQRSNGGGLIGLARLSLLLLLRFYSHLLRDKYDSTS